MLYCDSSQIALDLHSACEDGVKTIASDIVL